MPEGSLARPISALHMAARRYADAGIKIFPIKPGEKKPISGSRGFKDASTDRAQIDAWWFANPNYNIGTCPEDSGLCVLDVDGPEGEATLAKLGPLPETFAVHTPRGGRHLWFAGSLPSTAQKLGPKLDSRGRLGYVLLPPSIVDGKGYANASA